MRIDRMDEEGECGEMGKSVVVDWISFGKVEWGQRSRPQLEKVSMREGKPPEAQNGAAHALRELTKNVFGWGVFHRRTYWRRNVGRRRGKGMLISRWGRRK